VFFFSRQRLHFGLQLPLRETGGIPQPLKMYGGPWYGMVLIATHTIGFPFWEKIFEKKFG